MYELSIFEILQLKLILFGCNQCILTTKNSIISVVTKVLVVLVLVVYKQLQVRKKVNYSKINCPILPLSLLLSCHFIFFFNDLTFLFMSQTRTHTQRSIFFSFHVKFKSHMQKLYKIHPWERVPFFWKFSNEITKQMQIKTCLWQCCVV